jgi:hypothetical protein
MASSCNTFAGCNTFALYSALITSLPFTPPQAAGGGGSCNTFGCNAFACPLHREFLDLPYGRHIRLVRYSTDFVRHARS